MPIVKKEIYVCDCCKREYDPLTPVLLIDDPFINLTDFNDGYNFQLTINYQKDDKFDRTKDYTRKGILCPTCASELAKWLYYKYELNKHEPSVEKPPIVYNKRIDNFTCDKCVWQYTECGGPTLDGKCPTGISFKRDPPDGGYYG